MKDSSREKNLSQLLLGDSQEPQGLISQMEESVAPSLGSPDGTNDSTVISNANGLLLRPVVDGEWGEGLPYAPDDWPNPGDKWVWRIGKKKHSSGYWVNRYLYPPERLRATMGTTAKSFSSRPRVAAYLRKEFPDADIDAFFSSFQWKIPCAENDASEENAATRSLTRKRGRPPYPLHDSRDQHTDTRDECSILASKSPVDLSPVVEAKDPANVIPETENLLVKFAATESSCTRPTLQAEVAATEMVIQIPVTQHNISPSCTDQTLIIRPQPLVEGRKIPDYIQEGLTIAARSLMKELKFLPLEFLGDKMEYFNYHIEWFANLNFPIEELIQELNLRFKTYQGKSNRRREIETDLNKIKVTISKLEEELVELRRRADKLRHEKLQLFS